MSATVNVMSILRRIFARTPSLRTRVALATAIGTAIVTVIIGTIVWIGITGDREYWLDRRLDEAAARAVLEKAATQAERAGSILNRIRDFVRKSEPRRESVPLAEIVEGAVEIMTPEAKRHNVRLLVELPEVLPPVRADQILIEQVLVNLIRNGIEAMARTRPAARQIRVQAARQDERHVAVAVIDRGRGLSPEEREQIFTSFFTTKPDGLGMGLKICRSIVEFHEGRLMVEDNPQGGTVFRFTLPLEEVTLHE